MKLFTLFFACSLGLAHASESYAQTAIVNVEVQNKTVGEILKEIEKQSDFDFFFDNTLIDLNRRVSVTSRNSDIFKVLEKVFKGTNVKYSVLDKKIVLTTNTDDVQTAQQTTFKVTGKVVDNTGEGVIGATVLEQGTTNGTVTDMDGNFELVVSNKEVTLEISYIGYSKSVVKVKSGVAVTVTLKEDTEVLDEVVVVGYGTQKKVNLTGSVQAIEGDVIKDRPVMNVTQALQGQVAGVSFGVSGNGFEPGAKMNFSIRGQGNAYVLIDGVEGTMDNLNPNDIESISVLKDAAASAIYGARAPYGVVLITTKSGGRDTKPTVNFSANVSTAKMHRMPQMVDSYTFALANNEAGRNGGGAVFTEETIDRILAYQAGTITDETIANPNSPDFWASVQLANANHDWFEEFYGSGLRHQENISIKGGGKTTSYFISVGNAYDGGILNFDITDNYKRHNVNSKVDFDITDWWKFTTNTRVETTNRELPNFDNQGSYDLLFHQIARTFPNEALKDPNGYYTIMSKVPWAKEAGTDKKNWVDVTQRFATEIIPLKGWKINLDYSFRYSTNKVTSENFTVYDHKVDGTAVPNGSTVPAYVSKSQQQSLYQTTNMYTSYNKEIDGHDFTIMGGVQYETERKENMGGRKDDLVTSEVPSWGTSTGKIISLTDQLSHWSTAGAFFRLSYNYKDKYLFEANGRYDGTSKFAKGNRWGFFPSASVGWNVAHEDFWQNFSDKVNSLKIRASWGQLGNQGTPSNPIAPYQDLPLLGINNNLGWIINGQRPVYVTTPSLVNNMLTWETSETFDIGIDLGAFSNRLNVTADYYIRKTRDRLGPARALPAVIGAKLPNENNSEMRTNGWEISISWRDRLECGLGYFVKAQLSDYYNTITKYNNPTGILTTNYEGQRVGDIWGYETEGLIQTDAEAQDIMDNKRQDIFRKTWYKGDVHYKDLDGDGIITQGKNTVDDHGDKKVIGNNTPRYQFGVNLGFDYKGFDMSMFFQGVAKRDLWLSGSMFWGYSNAWNNNSLFPEHMDYYRDQEATKYCGLGVNTDAYFARPYQTDENNKNRQASDRYLQNGAYLRLKNMQIGYTLPQSFVKKIALQKVRFYLSGENLFTITGRFPKSLDPETANVGGRGNGKSYSAMQVFAFGLDLQF